MTGPARRSRWSRRFVVAGCWWFLCWQILVFAGGTQRAGLVVAVLGFVFHTIFGKAYSLLPSYFASELTGVRLLPVHLTTALVGTALLTVGIETGNPTARFGGATLWVLAVLLFVGILLWSFRGNLTGRETGTGDASSHRRDLDRLANRFVPVVLGYLVAGSFVLFLFEAGIDGPLTDNPARASHLLAAGGAGLLVFVVGFRVLPRFFAVRVPRALPWLVLPAGALGPSLLAIGLPDGSLFVAGAVFQTAAMAGFAITVVVLFARSDRHRVGFYGVAGSAVAAALAAGIGLVLAFDGLTSARILAHTRLNLLGFLGLVIVGLSYQFYPPATGTFRFASDRSALIALSLLSVGLLAEVVGLFGNYEHVVTAGHVLALCGALLHTSLVTLLFLEQRIPST